MSFSTTFKRRLALYGVLGVVGAASIGTILALESMRYAYEAASIQKETQVTPFPIGVNPAEAVIVEQAATDEFYVEYLAKTDSETHSLWTRLASALQTNQLFQQMASSVSRVVVIWPGERIEEAAQNIGDVLRWDATQRETFLALMQDNDLQFTQGYAVPGHYVTHRYATPEDMADELKSTFTSDVSDRYPESTESIVPLADALVIASLLEREARDFENMREISGVIWNRLFIDMPLQLDASLQYVKAEDSHDTTWWPAVRPDDKFIDSPFNTYQNHGLPPEPISNPSVEAIVAALNPRVTECLYYFHSSTREYYCSKTYPEHVQKLREVYGQGR